MQTRLDLESEGLHTVVSALESCLSKTPIEIKFNSEEIDLILSRLPLAGESLKVDLISTLCENERGRHAAPSLERLIVLLDDPTVPFASVLLLAEYLSDIETKFRFFSAAHSRIPTSKESELLVFLDALLASTNRDIQILWSDLLLNDVQFREYYGQFEADIEAISYLMKLGRFDKAKARCIAILDEFPAVTNEIAHSQYHSFVNVLDEIDSEYASLYREDQKGALPDRYLPYVAPALADNASDVKVRIIFVGGTEEEQGRRKEDVESQIFERYGEAVELNFVYPGWRSNWSPTIDRIMNLIQERDVVVLMPLVRTNFGRTLRRLIGEANAFWLPCTGNGVATMVNAIDRGIQLSLQRIQS
jgi:hypothetical protein